MDHDQAEVLLACAEQAAPRLDGDEAKEWADRLAERHQELSAALRSYVGAGGT